MSKYPHPRNKCDTEYKPLFRGVIHLFLSLILPFIIYIYQLYSFSSFVILTTCIISTLYHMTDANKYYTATVIFECLDYICINLLPFSYIYDISTHNIMLLNYILLFTICWEITLFVLQYGIFKMFFPKFIRQLSHAITGFIFLFYMIYYNLISIPTLITIFFYLIGYYFFFTKDPNAICPKWSAHESLHLVTIFAFFMHIYSIKLIINC